MSAVTPVMYIEVEAALQRVARGENTHDDANLLRSVFQSLLGTIRRYEEKELGNNAEKLGNVEAAQV